MTQDLQRISRLCQKFISRLPKEYLQNNPEGSRFAISISRRGNASNPNKSGRKYETVGSATMRQLITISATSPDDEEAVDRIHKLIIEGVDTTGNTSKQVTMTPQQVENMLAEKINALVNARLAEILAGNVQASDIAKQVTEKTQEALENVATTKPDNKNLPGGIQKKEKPASPYERRRMNNEVIQLWTERAKILGIDPPVTSKTKPGSIDGRWLRRATGLWEQTTHAPVDAANEQGQQPQS